ncbi:MAG TPA: SRPBCC family protein [Caulifigura sp.]|jgi:uncharacterized protein YndB with AHSA1/START domain|nr:SRPBCC family protein [Caulifigura sp.]
MADSRFYYVIYIRTSAEKLWDALRDPEFTRQYWAETYQISEWRVGAPWKLLIKDGRVADHGEVLEVDPPRKLVLSWQSQFLPELEKEGFSKLTFELEPVGESVKLTVLHEIGVEKSKLIESISNGWPHILSSLKTLLETGESLVETRKWPDGM